MGTLMERVGRHGDKLIHRLDEETLVIEPWGSDGLRVRATRNAEVLDTPWALLEPSPSEASIKIHEDRAVIRNGKISAEIQDTFTQCGRLQFSSISAAQRPPS